MIVTGAFFADGAAVQNEKLVVTGGVWDFVPVHSGVEAVGITMVVLLQCRPADHERDNRLHVECFSPTGETVGKIEAVLQNLGTFAENRFYHFMVPFRIPRFGRYGFAIDANGERPFSLGLDVREVPATSSN